MIDKRFIRDSWNMYLSLERDMDNTSIFVEPRNQRKVYSLEYARILMLSCVEFETLAKKLCRELGNTEKNIADYRRTINKLFPQIIDAEVYVSRSELHIKPFTGFSKQRPDWWDSYNKVKHDRTKNFTNATYENAIKALSGLYIILRYIQYEYENTCYSGNTYITSEYDYRNVCVQPEKLLPGYSSVTGDSSI